SRDAKHLLRFRGALTGKDARLADVTADVVSAYFGGLGVTLKTAQEHLAVGARIPRGGGAVGGCSPPRAPRSFGSAIRCFVQVADRNPRITVNNALFQQRRVWGLADASAGAAVPNARWRNCVREADAHPYVMRVNAT